MGGGSSPKNLWLGVSRVKSHLVPDTGFRGPVYWSSEVPRCSQCDFLGHWDPLWKHQGIGRVGLSGAREGCTVEREGRLLTDWLYKDTSGALPLHLTAPESTERRPWVHPGRGDITNFSGPEGQASPERPSAASSRSLRLAHSLARSLSCWLARLLGPQPPPFVRSPPAAPPHSPVARARCSSARSRTTAGCASARSRCPYPTARILLPRYLCPDPSVWTSLQEPSARNLLPRSLPLPEPHCLSGCPDPSA